MEIHVRTTSREEVRVAADGRRECIFYRLMVDSLIHEKQLAIFELSVI